MDADYSLRTAERLAVLRALRAASWNKRQAARLLGIGKTTLYRKIEMHGLAPSDGTEADAQCAEADGPPRMLGAVTHSCGG